MNKNIKKNLKKRNRMKLIIGISLILFVINGISILSVYNYKKIIKKYNDSCKIYNSKVSDYIGVTNQVSVSNISDMDTDIEKVQFLLDDIMSIAKYIKDGITLNVIDDGRKYMDTEGDNLSDAILIAKQIKNPTTTWVEERLKSLSEITQMQRVTTTDNPDGLLGKDGGYQTCIYFTTNKFDPKDVPGDSIVDKGVDAGGSIEVYKSLEEAKERCDYLSGFDNTILYSGSYALVGTMVIRTSYIFTDEEQEELTDKITQAFTQLDKYN